MKKKRNILTSCILKPLSVAYGTGMKLRNKMFDYGVLKQHEFDIPVIVVGNLSVGGTGKTPHTEYIIDARATGSASECSAAATAARPKDSSMPGHRRHRR